MTNKTLTLLPLVLGGLLLGQGCGDTSPPAGSDTVPQTQNPPATPTGTTTAAPDHVPEEYEDDGAHD